MNSRIAVSSTLLLLASACAQTQQAGFQSSHSPSQDDDATTLEWGGESDDDAVVLFIEIYDQNKHSSDTDLVEFEMKICDDDTSQTVAAVFENLWLAHEKEACKTKRNGRLVRLYECQRDLGEFEIKEMTEEKSNRIPRTGRHRLPCRIEVGRRPK